MLLVELLEGLLPPANSETMDARQALLANLQAASGGHVNDRLRHLIGR